MRRRNDWPEALAEYLESCRDRPFDVGSHHCGTMAAGAVRALTGVVIEVPTFASMADYAAWMREHSVGGMVDMHLPRVGKAHAQRGDIVLLNLDRPTLAVCCGIEAAAPGESGMLMAPMSLAYVAWKV